MNFNKILKALFGDGPLTYDQLVEKAQVVVGHMALM